MFCSIRSRIDFDPHKMCIELYSTCITALYCALYQITIYGVFCKLLVPCIVLFVPLCYIFLRMPYSSTCTPLSIVRNDFHKMTNQVDGFLLSRHVAGHKNLKNPY